MLKKIEKCLLVLCIIGGIAFSIFNFLSVELKAAPRTGAFIEEPDGTYTCRGDGSECTIDFGFFEP